MNHFLIKDEPCLSEEAVARRRQSFLDIFGSWTEEEYQEFTENTKIFEQIDEQDWVN